MKERKTVSARLLIVDDDQMILELLSDFLSPHFDIQIAHDGLEALELLSQDHYDALLIDLGLPRMGGVEVIQRVRSDSQTRHLPILVMSAYPELRKRVSAWDVQAVIGKPFSIEQFYLAVENVVSDHSSLHA